MDFDSSIFRWTHAHIPIQSIGVIVISECTKRLTVWQLAFQETRSKENANKPQEQQTTKPSDTSRPTYWPLSKPSSQPVPPPEELISQSPLPSFI